MLISPESLTIVLSVGAAQGVLLSVVLLTIRRGNRRANRILAAVLLILSVSIGIHGVAHTDSSSSHATNHASIALPLYMLIAPLLYLYTRFLANPGLRLERGLMRHGIPFALFAILILISRWTGTDDTLQLISSVLAAITLLQTVIYVLLSLRVLSRHASSIRGTYSFIEEVNLQWLRFLTLGYLVTWVAALAAEGHGGAESWHYVWILVAGFMYLIGYMGLRQPEIFSGEYQEPVLDATVTPRKKYERSALTGARADVCFQALQRMATEEKPYMESTLTLPDLADRLSVSTHHLSQIINERLQQNFFEYINRLRVEEAKRLLLDPEHQNMTIAAVGFESGFNSVSAFNNAFKKYAGTTPSRHRESHHRSP